MQERLGHLLDNALAIVEKTGDLNVALRQYPNQAEELRPLLEIADIVRHHYRAVPEAPNRLADARSHTLQAAEDRKAQKQTWEQLSHSTSKPPQAQRSLPHLRKPRARWTWRVVLALIAVAVALVPVGNEVLLAAHGSVPGQVLYPLDVTSENFHLGYIKDPELQVMLSLALVQERIQEAYILTQNQKPIPLEVISRVEYLSQRTLESAAWAKEPVMHVLLNYIAGQNQLFVQQIDILKHQVTDENQAKLDNIQRICLEKYLMAKSALEEPARFREAYRAGKPERMPLPGSGIFNWQPDPEVLQELTETPLITPFEPKR
jgi:hypothetical protein